jgi:hypothetical protein
MFRQKYNIALIEHHFLVKMAYLETIKAPIFIEASYQGKLNYYLAAFAKFKTTYAVLPPYSIGDLITIMLSSADANANL